MNKKNCEHDINVYHNCIEYYEMCNKCFNIWYYRGKKEQRYLKDIWDIK